MSRPRQCDPQKKVACNLSLTGKDIEALDRLASQHKKTTRSALVQAIARRELIIKPYDPRALDGVPIFRRIDNLSDEPVAAFTSIMAFAECMFIQCAREPSLERILTALLNAASILFYIGFVLPDTYINNPSSLLRYLLFEIILSSSIRRATDITDDQKVDNAQKLADTCLAVVGRAISGLDHTFDLPLDHQLLRAKSIYGLSVKEIVRIYSLRDQDLMNKHEVSSLIKQGLAKFRKNKSFYPSEEPDEQCIERVQKFLRCKGEYIAADVTDYVQLVLKPVGNLRHNQHDQTRLRQILLNTSHSAFLDLWLNEIDAYLGHENEPLRYKFRTVFRETIQLQRNYIEHKLTECETHEDLCEILRSAASDEAGTQLSLENLLGKHLPQWKKTLPPNQQPQAQQQGHNSKAR
jgi:hypothetical protein